MAYETALQTISMEANADLSAKQYYAVIVAADHKVGLPAGAGDAILGILQNEPGSGHAATVAVGGVSKAVAGGTFSQGDDLMTDANGKLVVISGALENICATALEDAVDGRIVSVLVRRGHNNPAS